MNTNIRIIIEFLSGQMDGEQVPPAESAAIDRIGEAVGQLLADHSSADMISLAEHTLGAVIDRVRSSIKAQQTLHAFLRGGDGHA